MMNILALETSISQCAVVLSVGDTVVQFEEFTPQCSRHILGMIEKALQTLNLLPARLDALAWGAGPGSFTGLRVGASVCQALAYAWQLPIISLSSLQICAQAAATQIDLAENQHIAVALDARMGGVYWGSFVWRNGRLDRIDNDQLLPANQGAVETYLHTDFSWVVMGDAWELPELNVILNGTKLDCTRVTHTGPLAHALLGLARLQPESEWILNPSECIPHYVRDATMWKKRERVTGV